MSTTTATTTTRKPAPKRQMSMLTYTYDADSIHHSKRAREVDEKLRKEAERAAEKLDDFMYGLSERAQSRRNRYMFAYSRAPVSSKVRAMFDERMRMCYGRSHYAILGDWSKSGVLTDARVLYSPTWGVRYTYALHMTFTAPDGAVFTKIRGMDCIFSMFFDMSCPLVRCLREAYVANILLGTTATAGRNSSLRRMQTHPLYERMMWWIIFQFMDLVPAAPSKPEK